MKYQRGMDNGGADKILSASLELVCSIGCTDADVVALRLENIGSSALTGFELRAKVSRDAPADAHRRIDHLQQEQQQLRQQQEQPQEQGQLQEQQRLQEWRLRPQWP